jgi:hypothetical protein
MTARGVHPMSDLQANWFERETRHPNPDLIMTEQNKITGRVDVRALRAAVTELLACHEALRSTFEASDAGGVRVVRELSAADVLFVDDLSDRPLPEAQARTADLIGAERWWRFDLTRGPLLRVRLVQTSAEVAVLSVVAHHIVVDGGAMGVLLRQLQASYAAHSAGRERSAEPGMSLAEWTADEARWKSTAAADRAREYWKDALAGITELHVPFNRPPESPELHDQDFAAFDAPDGLTGRIAEASRRLAALPATIYVGCFLRALAAATGRREVAALYLVNRRNRQTAGVVGCLLNSIVVPLSVTADRTADIKAVQGALLRGQRYQGLFIEEVFESCGIRTRAIDALMIFEKDDGERFALDPHPTAPYDGPLPPRPTRVGGWWENLTFRVVDSGAAVWGGAEYNARVYDQATMRRFVDSFAAELDALLAESAPSAAG